MSERVIKPAKCINCLDCEVRFVRKRLYYFLGVYCTKTNRYVGKYQDAEFIKVPDWCPYRKEGIDEGNKIQSL
jgi:hypothetical protein